MLDLEDLCSVTVRVEIVTTSSCTVNIWRNIFELDLMALWKENPLATAAKTVHKTRSIITMRQVNFPLHSFRYRCCHSGRSIAWATMWNGEWNVIWCNPIQKLQKLNESIYSRPVYHILSLFSRTACWSIVEIQEALHCLGRRNFVRSKLFFLIKTYPSKTFGLTERKKLLTNIQFFEVWNINKFISQINLEDYALNKFQHGHNSLLNSSIQCPVCLQTEISTFSIDGGRESHAPYVPSCKWNNLRHRFLQLGRPRIYVFRPSVRPSVCPLKPKFDQLWIFIGSPVGIGQLCRH